MNEHPTGAEGLFSRINGTFFDDEETALPETEKEKEDHISDMEEYGSFEDDLFGL